MFTKLMYREDLRVKVPTPESSEETTISIHAPNPPGKQFPNGSAANFVIEVPNGYHLKYTELDGALCVTVAKTPEVAEAAELIDGTPEDRRAPYFEVEYLAFTKQFELTFRVGGTAKRTNYDDVGRYESMEVVQKVARRHAQKAGLNPIYLLDISRPQK